MKCTFNDANVPEKLYHRLVLALCPLEEFETMYPVIEGEDLLSLAINESRDRVFTIVEELLAAQGQDQA